MKTLKELYDEVVASEELKKEYIKANRNGNLKEFLASHGCEATEEELIVFLAERQKGELSDDELDNISGGGICLRPVCPYCNCEIYGEDVYGYHPGCRLKWLYGE